MGPGPHRADFFRPWRASLRRKADCRHRCYHSLVITTLVFLSLVAALWLGLLLSPVHAWTHRNPLNADTPISPPPGDWPAVTVVVPARNEAAWLPVTVPSFCEQDYPDLRVIVVDDQSDDDSPAILRALRERYGNLAVVQAAPRPPGWCGKPWAVWQGVGQGAPVGEGHPSTTDSDWLLFTDADCVFHRAAARQAMALARAGGYDAVSLLAHMTFGSTLEAVALTGLATVLNLIMPMGLSNDPKSPVTLAAGGFILVKRSAYAKVGGHEAVKGQIIEDVQLGRKLKAGGAKLHTRATADLVGTRMYEGFADLWEGLSKNAYAGMDYDPKKFWVGIVIAVAVAVLPPVYLVAALVTAARTHSTMAWVAVGLAATAVVCQALIHLRTVRHMKMPAWHCALMPASAGIYAAVTCNSAWQHHFRGGNVWKGRRYPKEVTTAESGPTEQSAT